MAGVGNRIIGMRDNKVYDIDIIEGLDMKNSPRQDLIDLSKVLSI